MKTDGIDEIPGKEELMRDSIRLRMGCIFVFVSAWCAMSPAVNAGSTPYSIFVSIIPQEYFVERIGADRVTVRALVQPGDSPATYEPSPRQMAQLSSADVYFRIGVPFERVFMPKIRRTIPELTIVDTRQGIQLRDMKTHHDHAGHDTQHHGHDHAGKDPHIWLSPRRVKIQAQTIAATLSKLDPSGAGIYKKNLDAFLRELDRLDTRLSAALAPVKGKTFMVYHPSWGYFADDYGLIQEPIELEGKEPGGKQLAEIIDIARANNVSVIFVQPQFSRRQAGAVAEAIGGAVVPIDPLARDYIENLKSVAETVGRTLGGQR